MGVEMTHLCRDMDSDWPATWCGACGVANNGTDDVAACDCVECLRAAVDFGERCRARIAALSMPWPHNLGASLAYAGMLWTANAHGRDVLLGDVARMLEG